MSIKSTFPVQNIQTVASANYFQLSQVVCEIMQVLGKVRHLKPGLNSFKK